MNNPIYDQTSAIRKGEMLDSESLHGYLRSNLEHVSNSLTIEQFPRGFSNLTYLLKLGDRELVLRRPPFGVNIKSAHDMSREFRILSTLHPVYPKVPKPLLFCDDPTVLGAPFYVMERVHGVILRTGLPHGLEIAPPQMRQISTALVDTLVELHTVDVSAAGLGDLGKPAGYVERQVTGWIKRYANARTDDLPDMERAATWLADHLATIPDDGHNPTLIHNDFKYDNLVLNPQSAIRNSQLTIDSSQLTIDSSQLTIDSSQWIIAVLDWEMATLGHPLMDLGTTLGYWAEADDLPELRGFGVTSLPGNLTRREFVERYAQFSGRTLDQLLFFYVFGLFKIGVIIQQIYARYKQGYTQDERFATLDRLVAACGKTAVQAIGRGRIDALFS